MNKAVFLDRDGTINIDSGFIDHPNRVELIAGIKQALKLFQKFGFKLYIISNQSGIGRGYFTAEDFHKVQEKIDKELNKAGITINDIAYCPHRPEDSCKCRKPHPKMVVDIAKKDDINLTASFFIGDRISDIKTGKNAGCKTILFSDKTEEMKKDRNWIKPDYISDNIKDIAEWIVKNG